MEYFGFSQQWPSSSFDELSAISIDASFGENLYESFISHQSILGQKRPIEMSQIVEERPLKNPKTSDHSWNNNSYGENDQILSSKSVASPNYSHLINSNNNFTNQQLVTMKPKEETTLSSSSITFAADQHHNNNNIVCQDSFANQNYMYFKANNSCQGANNKSVSNINGKLTQAQDHIIAERKRREKLSQRFIALSALIPGLKKMDKASVLGDAIKYLKQLQERVKNLEEQTKKRAVESVAFVKKYEVYGDGENSSSDENYSSGTQAVVDESLPEIEARICGKDVLIRIHCEKRKGIVEKTVAEIEKLHLSVINTCALSFGTCALDITLIAQMDEEFAMTVKDLVKNLRSALKMFT